MYVVSVCKSVVTYLALTADLWKLLLAVQSDSSSCLDCVIEKDKQTYVSKVKDLVVIANNFGQNTRNHGTTDPGPGGYPALAENVKKKE